MCCPAPGPPWWIYVAVAGVVIFCLLPFYWLVNISLKTGPDLSSADIFPPNPSLENYKSIFQNDDFTRALANSAIVSLVTTFLGLLVGAFAAYALARLKMNFKFILLGIVLTISTFPRRPSTGERWTDWQPSTVSPACQLPGTSGATCTCSTPSRWRHFLP